MVLAHDKSLAFYSALTGQCVGTITDAHTEPVTQVVFSASGEQVLTSGDKHVRVFHNVPGIKMQIEELQVSLKKNLSNSAAKERIEKQINDAEATLKSIEM